MRGFIYSFYYLFSMRNHFYFHTPNNRYHHCVQNNDPMVMKREHNKKSEKPSKMISIVPVEIPNKRNNNTGFDERYNASYHYTLDQHEYFHRIFYQWKLLQLFQDPLISVYDKMDRLETDSFYFTPFLFHNNAGNASRLLPKTTTPSTGSSNDKPYTFHSKYTPNFYNGGLMKDW